MAAGNDDGFTLVGKGSKMRARPRRGEASCLPSNSRLADDDESIGVESTLARIQEAMEQLKGAPAWLNSVIDTVKSESQSCAKRTHHQQPSDFRYKDIVCYGVGHFGRGGASALQAALALCLRVGLEIQGSLHLYDPVLTENEASAARSLGFSVIDENETGLRRVSEATLFFMPHCGRRLYSNVLRANWTFEGLSMLSILGNSFEAYRIRMLSPRKLECCCISRLGEEHCQEQRLPTCPHGEAAFNDTCFHTFSPPISLEESLGTLHDDIGGDDHTWC